MLSTELGLASSDNLKIIELKDLITNSDRYDDEFVKNMLIVIVEERTATEKQKTAELEEKQKAAVVAQQREREFELEKMKIQLEMQKLSQAPITSQQLQNLKLELNRIIPRFNSMEDEMGPYLTIFKRQVKFLNIPEKTWTAYLIGSLPPDIAQLITREDKEDAQNYKKKRLLYVPIPVLPIPLQVERCLNSYKIMMSPLRRISFMMADGNRQTIMALSTVVDLCIECKVIPTEFLVLPDAKGNKTLLGLYFLNAA
ncbi:uncharacterized protein TNCV_3326871 [Trichonephila clavipes]|nr:uncharacterized protein TNCV_3326871 [Trichonephila clavipes]